MSRRKNKPWDAETEKLEQFCYENDLEQELVQFSKYHFRLKNKIDIWPGSKKFWIIGKRGSENYQDINEIKKHL